MSNKSFSQEPMLPKCKYLKKQKQKQTCISSEDSELFKPLPPDQYRGPKKSSKFNIDIYRIFRNSFSQEPLPLKSKYLH